jgi:hypothetical protein
LPYTGHQNLLNGLDNTLTSILLEDAKEWAFENGTHSVATAYGEYTAFVECVKPAITLAIIGAGNDAVPLYQNGVRFWAGILRLLMAAQLRYRPNAFPCRQNKLIGTKADDQFYLTLKLTNGQPSY